MPLLRRLLLQPAPWLAAFMLCCAAPAWAILPEAAKPTPAQAPAARAAKAAQGAASTQAEDAAEVKQRGKLEVCLADLATLRRETAEACVMAGSTCYRKDSCERLSDGRYQCGAVNRELTQKYRQVTSTPCQ